MTSHDLPPGWDYNPSAWPHRLPVLGLAVAGCAIATYLTLFQVAVLGSVWEPFFGNGSEYLLKQSPVAHFLPLPDASLGAFVYLCEAVADLLGGPSRWRTAPWAVLLLGLIACSLGLAGVALALGQPLLAGTYCTLCLGSAACSVLGVGPVMNEVLATLQHLQRSQPPAAPGGRPSGDAFPPQQAPRRPAGSNRDDGRRRGAASLAAVVGLWLMDMLAVLHFSGQASLNWRMSARWRPGRRDRPARGNAGTAAAERATGRLAGSVAVAPRLWRHAVLNSVLCGCLLLLCGLVPGGRTALPAPGALWGGGRRRKASRGR